MINVERVTKFYGAHAAVRDLDFQIEEGECVGFLGLNGAGKTTTLRMLSCLVVPTSGKVTVRGLDAETSPHEIRKLIGFLPDRPPIYEEMRVSEYLHFAGKLRQMSSQMLRARAPEVAEQCGLTEVWDDPLASLSHGYKQRVGIAQAVIHKPALLILDEPIQGLDPVQIVEMRNMIRDLRGQHTILLSSHILSEIEQTCDRILMLHKGRIAASGTEAELAASVGSRFALELRVGADEAALRQALAAVPDLSIDSVKVEEGVALASLVAERDLRAELSRAIVGAKLDLLGLSGRQSGLEGIFMSLSQAKSEVPPAAAASDSNAEASAEGGEAEDTESAERTEDVPVVH